MREIKFRGKRIDNGMWVYGDYFKTPLTDENSGTTPDAGWFFITGEQRHCIGQNGVAFVVDPETVGQYTGLHDKNGKEIYEGDQLFASGNLNDDLQYVGDVVWDDQDARWEVHNFHGKFECIPSECIAQGNIYENPELVNK